MKNVGSRKPAPGPSHGRSGDRISANASGALREDYSENGDAWNFFTHDHARSRAYRWGEDGIAGISDDKQNLCFSLALWNGKDPILKERLFGLTNSEGNHGEDVKEYYFYLDSTPTHSYMKYLYKYPQAAYPYGNLVSSSFLGQKGQPFGKPFDTIFDDRLREADEFYESVTPQSVGQDAANVMRQAIAGMLWSKQFFFFDGDNWLDEHRSNPLHSGYRNARNSEWFHMLNRDIISMPDKWEYPWYAAWDLAFHTLPLSIVDPDFAKQQMGLMLRGTYLHPNGQVPAYEWNFSDVNPPVHAFATLFLHRTEQALRGDVDVHFLRSIFNKLLLNFTWWVNRKDRFGKNVFEGGFLGLDNIGVFDRSAPLPTGGHLEQADGTAWMALFSQNMLELAVELAAHDPDYEEMVFKFVEHFYYIAAGINRSEAVGMWDDEDGFYYDLLRLPDGSGQRLKVRSMVGLLPLCATTVIEQWQRERIPRAMDAIRERLRRMPELSTTMHPVGPDHFGVAERALLALVTPERLRRILTKMLDENEFLSPYGIRALSKFHERHPYIFRAGGQEYRVDYLPAESNTGMFGGNSNWRGPIWMPVNVILIRALLNFYAYYGDNFKIECPTGSGRRMNLFEVAKEISDRLTRIFTRDERGRRPVYGGTETFQTDPYWRDNILFYEYFHADNGAGLGASHQTGWTGVVAKLIQLFGMLDAEKLLEAGKQGAFVRATSEVR